MKIPKKMRIGGLEWTIKFDKDVAAQGEIFGSTHFDTQLIFIDPRAPKDKQEQTFVHELLHVINYQWGIAKRMNDKDEEELVNAQAFGLYAALKENGLLK